MDKQEVITALKACMAEDDENQCTGCPGDEGLICRYMKNYEQIMIPELLLNGAIEILEGNDDEYKRGLDAAWDAIKTLCDDRLSGDDVKDIFGTPLIPSIVKKFSAEEVIEKLNGLMRDLSMGDEVERITDRTKFVVIRPSQLDKKRVYLMDRDGMVGWYVVSGFKRTGRHFGYLEQILKNLGRESDDAE